ncbi:hypothetical protein BGX38DRAFT_1275755 [Terfezia claveryi]|nr:hypothetical protein BGX38DRAFT_1275755 [Terfezia claveryi]
MLFEEGDAALLLQNWIVKRLEDMYVPRSTVSSYTRNFVHDVFAALRSKEKKEELFNMEIEQRRVLMEKL